MYRSGLLALDVDVRTLDVVLEQLEREIRALARRLASTSAVVVST
jgi:hypothetical protein